MRINKKASKTRKVFVLQIAFFFFIKIGCNCFLSSIILLHVITESSVIFAEYLPFLQLHLAGFQIYSISHGWCFYTHINIYLSLLHHWFELNFFPSNLHLHSHDICSVNVFDSFIPVIMLIMLRFRSSALVGTHTLLDKSLRVSQLPTHLSNLTTNKSWWNSWLYSLGCKLIRVG